jgi:hypothetical protein
MAQRRHNLGNSPGAGIVFLIGNSDKEALQKDTEKQFNIIRRSTATVVLQLTERSALFSREAVERIQRPKKLVPTEE